MTAGTDTPPDQEGGADETSRPRLQWVVIVLTDWPPAGTRWLRGPVAGHRS